MLMMLLQIHNIVTHCRKFKNERTFIYLFCKVEVTKLSIMIIHGSILLNTTAHPKDIIPRRGLITGAKIQYFLHKSKKMAIFSPFSV